MRLTDVQRRAERIAAYVEGADWIDAAAVPIHRVASRFTRLDPRERDVLSGTGLAHPAHPAIVLGPLGCWAGALIADASREPDAARRLTGTGVLLAVPAVATGLSDWTDTTGAERRVGFLHLTANLTATALQLVSWRARRRGRHTAGAVYGILAGLTSGAAGWLGGHLTYAMGVGVDTTAFDGGPTEWTTVTRNEDNPRAGSAGGVPLVIVERDGQTYVLAGRCTHRGGPLFEGELDGDCLVCPWHDSRFSIHDGSVQSGPAVAPQPAYEVRETAEGLQVRRSESRSLRVNPVR